MNLQLPFFHKLKHQNTFQKKKKEILNLKNDDVKNEENEFFEIKHQKQFSKVENESNRDSMQLKIPT